MANLTRIHCNLSVIDKSGQDINIRPLIDGKDVSVSSTPAGTNAQGFVDAIGRTAFLKRFNGIDDSKGLETEDFAYSVDKILQVVDNTDIVITECKAEYSGWF